MADSLFIYPGPDSSLVVWDMGRQKELGVLVGHDQQIHAVAARGNLALSAQDNGPPRVWNLETLQCTAMLPTVSHVFSARCTEDRGMLGLFAGPIKLWDIAASAPIPLPDLAGHTGMVLSIKATANTVLSGSNDRTLRLWDLRTGTCVRTMAGHTDAVVTADMDEHCRTAVSGSRDKLVKLWDLGSGRCTATFEGHSSTVRDVVMHESERSFLSSGVRDCMVSAWAVGSDEASMRADLNAFTLPDYRFSHMFASRDLSKVAYCCLTAKELVFRLLFRLFSASRDLEQGMLYLINTYSLYRPPDTSQARSTYFKRQPHSVVALWPRKETRAPVVIRTHSNASGSHRVHSMGRGVLLNGQICVWGGP